MHCNSFYFLIVGNWKIFRLSNNDMTALNSFYQVLFFYFSTTKNNSSPLLMHFGNITVMHAFEEVALHPEERRRIKWEVGIAKSWSLDDFTTSSHVSFSLRENKSKINSQNYYPSSLLHYHKHTLRLIEGLCVMWSAQGRVSYMLKEMNEVLLSSVLSSGSASCLLCLPLFQPSGLQRKQTHE